MSFIAFGGLQAHEYSGQAASVATQALALRLRSGLRWTAEAAVPTSAVPASALARLSARGLHDGSDAFREVGEIGDQLGRFVDLEIHS
jgi:hypothetical protein